MGNSSFDTVPNTSSRWLARGATLSAVAALLFLLVAHAAIARRGPFNRIEYARWVDGKWYSMATWRYWEDMKFAIGRYLDWTRGPKGGETTTAPTALTDAYRDATIRYTRRLGLRSWQFWRTLPTNPYLVRRTPYEVPLLEDTGRGVVTAIGFAWLGGISPFLPFWLAVIAAIPVAVWLFLELAAARGKTAGFVVLGGLAASPYLAESLTLPHSAVGFHHVALLAAAALAVYAVLGECRSPLLFWVRVAAAGGLGALCTVCRSGTLSLLPGALLMVWIAARRVFSSAEPSARAPWWRLRTRGWMAALAAAALLVGPYLLVKPSQRHPVWLGLFEGLADFGEERGYSWHDRDAKRLMIEHGLTPFEHPNQVTAAHEEFFRDVFLRDVAAAPLWYAGILFKRTFATLTQVKLLPWTPLDGASVSKPVFHYKYATPVDWVGVSAFRMWELPLPVLWIPAIALVILAVRRADRGDFRRSARADVVVLALLAVSALPLPVLVTTAGGIETQAFALTYLLAAALAVQRLVGQRGTHPSRSR